jgi:hypothetical protein
VRRFKENAHHWGSLDPRANIFAQNDGPFNQYEPSRPILKTTFLRYCSLLDDANGAGYLRAPFEEVHRARGQILASGRDV